MFAGLTEGAVNEMCAGDLMNPVVPVFVCVACVCGRGGGGGGGAGGRGMVCGGGRGSVTRGKIRTGCIETFPRGENWPGIGKLLQSG